jgi:hypothetical protein
LESFILDQILLAVDDVDFAISKLADVARAEPAVEEGVTGCLRVVVVAAGDDRAFAKDLTGRAGWDVVEIFVYDPAPWLGQVRGASCTMEANSRETDKEARRLTVMTGLVAIY